MRHINNSAVFIMKKKITDILPKLDKTAKLRLPKHNDTD